MARGPRQLQEFLWAPWGLSLMLFLSTPEGPCTKPHPHPSIQKPTPGQLLSYLPVHLGITGDRHRAGRADISPRLLGEGRTQSWATAGWQGLSLSRPEWLLWTVRDEREPLAGLGCGSCRDLMNVPKWGGSFWEGGEFQLQPGSGVRGLLPGTTGESGGGTGGLSRLAFIPTLDGTSALLSALGWAPAAPPGSQAVTCSPFQLESWSPFVAAALVPPQAPPT